VELLGTESLQLHAELDREVGDPAHYHAVATQWFGGGLDRLAGELRERIETGPPLSDTGVRATASRPARQAPHGVDVGAAPRPARRVGLLAGQLGSIHPGASRPAGPGQVRAIVLDGRGFPSRSGMGLTVERPDDASGWVVLSADAPAEEFTDPARGHLLQRRWLGFVRDVAGDLNPSFGHLADDNRGGGTSLDVLLRRLRDQSVADSRTVLRGYSWVTICGQELADRLGGVDALRATRAFHEVEPVRAGGVWLQATERYQDYGPAQITDVFRAVAPVLPAGRSTPRRGSQ
jgi:hypothetical protein